MRIGTILYITSRIQIRLRLVSFDFMSSSSNSNSHWQEGLSKGDYHDSILLRRETEEDIARLWDIIHEEQWIVASNIQILNSLIPIAKLLPEILSEIFIHIATNPFSYSNPPTSSRSNASNKVHTIGPYDWIVITHVCHHWREVALKSPRLWSFIYLGPSEPVQEFLARSGQAPLHIRPWTTITTTSSTPAPRDHGSPQTLKASVLAYSLRLILAEVHRIESMSLKLRAPVLERVFGQFDEDGLSAPRLRSLTFCSSGEQAFPKILSKCHFPMLIHVSMSKYVVPWHLSFLRTESITSLELHQAQFTSVDFIQSTIRTILDTLSHLPRLEELELSHGPTLDGSSSPHGMPAVHFPCLQQLTIRSTAANIDTFLSHCTFPSTTITQLEIPTERNGRHWSEESSSLLRSVISKSVDVVQGYMPISGLSICIKPVATAETNMVRNNECQVMISTYHFDPASIPRYIDTLIPRPRFSVKFVYTEPLNTRDLLHNLCSSLSLDRTTYLHISCTAQSKINDADPNSDLGNFVANLITRCSPTGLEALHIAGLNFSIMRSILASWCSLPFRDVTINGTETPFDAHSNSIVARGLFGSIRTLILSEITSEMSSPDFTDLCDSIQSQAQYYRGQCISFTKLVFQGCSVEHDWLFDLVDAVAELFYQQHRFTKTLPSKPYGISPVFGQSSARNLPNHNEPSRSLPTQGNWADYVESGRVTLDFRGRPHIEIERDV
ncbi:hypothetical protein QCA50_006173 [Cerrena zonata]|uniref:F-box domain-containing protein n=1 Tax=Cerrena zonata TaxID=2478898 RepID=A0AAW0GIM4_9APHY